MLPYFLFSLSNTIVYLGNVFVCRRYFLSMVIHVLFIFNQIVDPMGLIVDINLVIMMVLQPFEHKTSLIPLFKPENSVIVLCWATVCNVYGNALCLGSLSLEFCLMWPGEGAFLYSAACHQSYAPLRGAPPLPPPPPDYPCVTTNPSPFSGRARVLAVGGGGILAQTGVYIGAKTSPLSSTSPPNINDNVKGGLTVKHQVFNVLY